MKNKKLDSSLYKSFMGQKGNAATRGIEFLLTYEEWLKFWQDSGKLDQRGRGRSKYVMARFGDTGPYALGNIKIILGPENNAEGALKVVFTAESLAKISKAH